MAPTVTAAMGKLANFVIANTGSSGPAVSSDPVLVHAKSPTRVDAERGKLCFGTADGFRRAVLVSDVDDHDSRDTVPGVVVLDPHVNVESISPQAERWLELVVEIPPAPHPHETRVVQAVATRARHAPPAHPTALRRGRGCKPSRANGCSTTPPDWPARSTAVLRSSCNPPAPSRSPPWSRRPTGCPSASATSPVCASEA